MGMHIIFLLTDSFNKALRQSAATGSTLYLLNNVYIYRKNIPCYNEQSGSILLKLYRIFQKAHFSSSDFAPWDKINITVTTL